MTYRRWCVFAVLLCSLACGVGGQGRPIHESTPRPDPVPEPAAAQVTAYLTGLTAIDRRIIGNHSREAMLGRGMATCEDLRDGRSGEDLAIRANHRFTAPEMPDGFGMDVARRIVASVQRTLCPQYPLTT